MSSAARQTPPRPAVCRAVSYQDVLDAGSNKVVEIIAGTLHAHPRPAMSHALAGSGLGVTIGSPFHYGNGGPGGWWILDEPELHLGKDIVVPDLAGWRRERMPTYPNTAYCTIPPDWACEVLSPSTRQIDLGPKREIYAREGVCCLWFVDPDARTLEAFRLHKGQWLLIASLSEADAVSIPPFDAISFDLSGLWVPDPKSAPSPEAGDIER